MKLHVKGLWFFSSVLEVKSGNGTKGNPVEELVEAFVNRLLEELELVVPRSRRMPSHWRENYFHLAWRPRDSLSLTCIHKTHVRATLEAGEQNPIG